MSAPAILESRALCKRFGGAQVINGLDIRIATGEIRCVIGPNGAGKSTFFKLLTGEHRPTSGDIRFMGTPLGNAPPHQRIRMGMSIKFQIPGIFPALTVREHLRLGMHQAGASGAEALAALLRQFMLEPEADVPARQLSHGKKQWLEIAMAVSLRPKLLLLDEPVAGMSVEETQATGDLLLRLRDQGLTLLVVEHDMTFVKQIATRVTVLHGGRLFAEGSTAEILARDDVAEIYLGRRQ